MPKYNTTVNVEVENIVYRELESINITINETTVTGSIKVDINSTLEGFTNITRDLTLDGNKAQLNLTGLAVGEYNVTVFYDGDSRFNGNFTKDAFLVEKLADYELNVTAQNILYGEEENIVITLPIDAQGNVKIDIAGTDITDRIVPVTEGRSNLTIPAYF